MRCAWFARRLFGGGRHAAKFRWSIVDTTAFHLPIRIIRPYSKLPNIENPIGADYGVYLCGWAVAAYIVVSSGAVVSSDTTGDEYSKMPRLRSSARPVCPCIDDQEWIFV